MTVCAVLASLSPFSGRVVFRLRRDEADCRSHGRRNDHVHDSRTDSRSDVLRVDEGTSPAAGHVAAGTSGIGFGRVLFCRPNQTSPFD
jgi:hypothetical protein